jgi:hypothetical protein
MLASANVRGKDEAIIEAINAGPQPTPAGYWPARLPRPSLFLEVCGASVRTASIYPVRVQDMSQPCIVTAVTLDDLVPSSVMHKERAASIKPRWPAGLLALSIPHSPLPLSIISLSLFILHQRCSSLSASSSSPPPPSWPPRPSQPPFPYPTRGVRSPPPPIHKLPLPIQFRYNPKV